MDTRGERATFVVLSLAFLFLTAATVLSTAAQIGKPWQGFAVWRNLVAPAIGGPDWPGNRAGIPLRAAVVAADGTPLHSAAELRAMLNRGALGQVLAYDFDHDGANVRVAVPVTRLRWRDVLPVYLPYWIDGAAFFLVGLTVFYFRPGLPAARGALALGAVLGSVLLLASDVFSSFWLDPLYFVCESMTPAVLLHLALCFPEEKPIVQRHACILWAIYLAFTPLAVLQVAHLYGDPRSHLAVNDWVYTAIGAAGIFWVAMLTHAVLTTENPLARQQAKVVLAGVGAAAFVPSLGIFAIVVFGADVPMNLTAPFFIVYPLSIGYAIARHDLFAVDRYLRLGVVYASLTLVVFLSYFGFVLGGEALLGARVALRSGVIPVYVLIVVLLFDPLRAAIQRLVDRLFYRQAVSYRGTVEATSRVLASVLDADRIADTVLSTLTEVMAIDWAVLIVCGAEASDLRFYARPAAKRQEAESLLRGEVTWVTQFGTRRAPQSRYEIEARGAAELRLSGETAVFDRLGTVLAFPMRFESAPVGALLVGEKKSGAFYGDEDIQLLDTLVHQSALAFTNARAYEIIRETQAELVLSERLAAVGELASTVAHGIRNPLAGIRASAQVAREELDSDSPVAESLDDIISEADRLESRVRSILDLSRPGLSEPVRGDLNDFLRTFAAGCRARLVATVRLEMETDAAIPPLSFDPIQLGETLDILVTNAVESMARSGVIRLRSSLEANGAPGPQVAIAVADSGPGIDRARIEQVFELFYTTKPTGTGVGLAMAKRLVERQGGSIGVESEPGHGATFTIRLPVAAAARADARA